VKTTFLFTSWMHLGDEVLARLALGSEHHETRVQAHLDGCPRCQARLDDLRALLDTQRRDAKVTLSSFRGHKPVVLAFGSYT
jgi:hypothetical protein